MWLRKLTNFSLKYMVLIVSYVMSLVYFSKMSTSSNFIHHNDNVSKKVPIFFIDKYNNDYFVPCKTFKISLKLKLLKILRWNQFIFLLHKILVIWENHWETCCVKLSMYYYGNNVLWEEEAGLRNLNHSFVKTINFFRLISHPSCCHGNGIHCFPPLCNCMVILQRDERLLLILLVMFNNFYLLVSRNCLKPFQKTML